MKNIVVRPVRHARDSSDILHDAVVGITHEEVDASIELTMMSRMMPYGDRRRRKGAAC